MRIFVTGTGRCGTVTFFRAAAHARNLKVGHESQTGHEAVNHWQYPDNHIEVSCQLAFAMPILLRRYPDAKWIHLVRQREACVRSLAGQLTVEMQHWAEHVFQAFRPNPIAAAEAFYDCTVATIDALLPPGSLRLEMERAERLWSEVWRFMGCQGDFEASRSEWRRAYNAAGHRGRENWKPA